MKRKTEVEQSTARVDVADGFRALSILCVMAFHIWQQSWLGGLRIPGLAGTALGELPPREFFATGSYSVDVLLLLSAFLLFLPHAREMVGSGSGSFSPARFYLKRIARIVPSVYFHMLVLQLFFLRPADYGGSALAYLKDTVNNWLFSQNAPLFKNVPSLYTGTLWTLTVEMTFYLLFPLLARCFRKQPGLTLLALLGMGEAYIRLYAVPQIQAGNTLPHRQFPAYLGLFAVGMLAALIDARIEQSELRRKRWMPWAATGLALGSIFLLVRLLWQGMGHAASLPLWQTENRLMMACLTALALLSAAFAVRGFRRLLANPLTRFLSAISLNLYIWHQFLALRFKEWRIPFYPDAPEDAFAWPQGGDFPGHGAWQWQYTLLVWLASILVATLVTYGIERPCARALRRLPVETWEKKLRHRSKRGA